MTIREIHIARREKSRFLRKLAGRLPADDYQRIVKKVKGIALTQEHYAFVDAPDFLWLSFYSWMYHPKGYAYRTEWNHGSKRHIFMHNEIMGVERGVDHKNRDGLDNRRENLRMATRSQNGANRGRQKNNGGLYKGIYKDGNLWYARIQYKGKSYKSSGVPEGRWAAWLYDLAAREIYGEFAGLNFKD